jgi:hypothetical protein
LYRDYFLPTPRFDFVITGHSHRRGLYQITAVHDHGKNHVHTKYLEYKDAKSFNGAKIIVSDSAGNLPRYNIYGEFLGWGSAKPSYTRVVVDGAGNLDRLEAQETKNPQAWPRIAVAMDYLYVLEGIDIIRGFETDGMSESDLFAAPKLRFVLEWVEQFKFLDLESMAIYTHINGAPVRAKAVCGKRSDHTIICEFDFGSSSMADRFKRTATSTTRRTFASMIFKKVNSPGWSHYNYASPYNFEIEITHKWVFNNNWLRISRSSDGKDIPDWDWRKQMYA